MKLPFHPLFAAISAVDKMFEVLKYKEPRFNLCKIYQSKMFIEMIFLMKQIKFHIYTYCTAADLFVLKMGIRIFLLSPFDFFSAVQYGVSVCFRDFDND